MAGKKPGPKPLHAHKTKAHPGFAAEEKKLRAKGYSKAKAEDVLGAAYVRALRKRGGK